MTHSLKRPASLSSLLLAAGLLLPASAGALTTGELLRACEQAGRPCAEVPWVQAYVGGALDLLATLDEGTDYLSPIYCKDPKQLFDVAGILGYIERHGPGHGEENAMALLVRFLEEYGGC